MCVVCVCVLCACVVCVCVCVRKYVWFMHENGLKQIDDMTTIVHKHVCIGHKLSYALNYVCRFPFVCLFCKLGYQPLFTFTKEGYRLKTICRNAKSSYFLYIFSRSEVSCKYSVIYILALCKRFLTIYMHNVRCTKTLGSLLNFIHGQLAV